MKILKDKMEILRLCSLRGGTDDPNKYVQEGTRAGMRPSLPIMDIGYDAGRPITTRGIMRAERKEPLIIPAIAYVSFSIFVGYIIGSLYGLVHGLIALLFWPIGLLLGMWERIRGG